MKVSKAIELLTDWFKPDDEIMIDWLEQDDLILMDDDRPRNGMKEVYKEACKYDIPVIGNQHGSQDITNSLPNLRRLDRTSWDYI